MDFVVAGGGFFLQSGRSPAIEPSSSGTAAGADHHGPSGTTPGSNHHGASAATGAPSSPYRHRAISARTTSDTATAAAKASRNRKLFGR